MSVFPQNNFLILKSEELFKNQILTMKQVFNFLELDENLSSQSEYKALNAGIYNKKNNETEVYRALADFFEPYNQKLEDYYSAFCFVILFLHFYHCFFYNHR